MVFSGIIEAMGTVKSLTKDVIDMWDGSRREGYVLAVNCPGFFSAEKEGVKEGDSIAVNGVCLTVVTYDDDNATFGLAPETIARTNLIDCEAGSRVNLEHSLGAGQRNSGHYVQGHVDGTGVLEKTWKEDDSLWVRIKCDKQLLRGLVPKGYGAVDGASLTICEVNRAEGWFTFMLISYSQAHLCLPKKPLGSRINIEIDVIGKYVEQAVSGLSGRVEAMESDAAALQVKVGRLSGFVAALLVLLFAVLYQATFM